MDDLSMMKQLAGVPEALQSCHTAVIDGRTIEGHVPAHAIERFLANADKSRGIAVPGMPQGSPGMPSPLPERYEVIAFGNGKQAVIDRYKGDEPAAD